MSLFPSTTLRCSCLVMLARVILITKALRPSALIVHNRLPLSRNLSGLGRRSQLRIRTQSNHAPWQFSNPMDEPPCSISPSISTSRLFASDQLTESTNSPGLSILPPTSQQQHSTTSIIMDGLNPSQVEAVTQPQIGITRVLAGPGSGKTKVLTCRIAYLLEEDRFNKVLAVTFTKKAAGEMRQRLENLLELRQSVEDDLDGSQPSEIVQEGDPGGAPRGLERVTLGTFHSVCAKILRYNGLLLAELPSVVNDMTNPEIPVNLDSSFAIVDQSDQLRILKECLDEAEVDLKKSGVKPLVILNAIGTIKESLSQGLDPFKSNDKRKPVSKGVRLAKSVYNLYREKLFSNNALDFDDLIYLTRELLDQHEDVRGRLHKRWGHILVDEFQDTSRSQMDLVKLLTSSSLFVVGDADQSIYSWRGAHVGSMSDFVEEMKNYDENGVTSVYLKENYRSTSNIVKAAEKVISMESNQSAESRRSMKPKRGSGPSPRVVACKDERGESNFVVDNISEMLISGDLQPHETAAIIYRTNAQSRYLEEACVQKNLPYVIRGGGASFYKRAEVKDCLCFLRWLQNGNDEASMIRAMRTPSRGIGDVAIRDFKTYLGEVGAHFLQHHPTKKRPTPLEVLISITDEETHSTPILEPGTPEAASSIPKRALNKFLPFSKQMRDIREKASTVSIDALLVFIIDSLDLIHHFDTISKSKAEFEDRRENVQELRQASKRYSKGAAALEVINVGEEGFAETQLSTFLDDVALVSDITDSEEGGKESESRFVVNLMTIHGSKGMEFDVVFVVGNEEGTLPSGLSIQEGEGSVALEEERRLCYVAMTRAKTRLLMTWRKEVTNFSDWSDRGLKTVTKERSRFLDALVSRKGPPKSNSKKRGMPGSADGNLHRKQRRQISPQSGPSQTNRGGATKQVQNSNSLAPPHKRKVRQPVTTSRPYLNPDRFATKPMKTTTTQREARRKVRSAAINEAPSPLQPKARGRPLPSSQSRPKVERPPIQSQARAVQKPPPQDRPMVQRPQSRPSYHRPNGQITPPAKNGPIPQRPTLRKRAPDLEAARREYDAGTPYPAKPKKQQTQENSSMQTMDSTWFFPVGSAVIHEDLGKGTVLPPPPPKDPKDLPVLVKFASGREMQFCARGEELSPDLGF